MKATVRVTAEIDDEVEVDVPDGSSDDEIVEAAYAGWTFVEGSSWGAEIIDREEDGRV